MFCFLVNLRFDGMLGDTLPPAPVAVEASSGELDSVTVETEAHDNKAFESDGNNNNDAGRVNCYFCILGKTHCFEQKILVDSFLNKAMPVTYTNKIFFMVSIKLCYSQKFCVNAAVIFYIQVM